MVLIGLVLACAVSRSDSESGLILDTAYSYRGFTELQEVSAACEGDDVVVRARTLGWTEEAQVEVWGPDGLYVAPVAMSSVAFLRDETCDIVEATLTESEHGLSCADLLAGTLTFFVRIQFEVGCGGMKAWGALPEERVYTKDVDPTPDTTAECELNEDYAESVMGEVVEAISPCSEAVR